METDNDLISAALATDLDFWNADKEQRFLNIDDEIPVIAGGLTSAEISRFAQSNWILEETKRDVIEWPVGFGSESPGEIVVKWGPLPRGTQILRNLLANIDLVRQ